MTYLDRLEALEKEATEPPWKLIWTGEARPVYEDNDDEPRDFSNVDCELIAALRNAAPALIAVARAAEWECEHLGGSEGLLNALARLDAEAPYRLPKEYEDAIAKADTEAPDA